MLSLSGASSDGSANTRFASALACVDGGMAATMQPESMACASLQSKERLRQNERKPLAAHTMLRQSNSRRDNSHDIRLTLLPCTGDAHASLRSHLPGQACISSTRQGEKALQSGLGAIPGEDRLARC